MEVLGLSPALRPFCLGELAPPCPQGASSSASGSTGSGVGAARRADTGTRVRRPS